MGSIVKSSDVFLMTILPLSTSTASEKLRTTLLPAAIAVALSEGVLLVRVIGRSYWVSRCCCFISSSHLEAPGTTFAV